MRSFHKTILQSLPVTAGIIGLSLLSPLSNSAQMMPAGSSINDAPATAANQRLSQLLQLASNQGAFTTLAQLVQTAGLTNALQGTNGSYTIFAPTDAAFAELPREVLAKLQRPENRALLKRVLAYHVVPQKLPANQLSTGSLETLGGGIAVRVTEDRVVVNNGSVVQPNIPAFNGVVHAVNRVLLPAELRQQLISLR